MRELFAFPNPVNEVAARLVAGGVVAMAVLYVVTSNPLVLAVLAYGFVARVAAGPRFSPLGRLVTQIIVPRLRVEPKLVAGPPKRFAQAIGATLSVAAGVAHLMGAPALATGLVAAIAVAASLEAFLAYCLGCQIFGLLMRTGIVPEQVCLDCADISRRLDQQSAARSSV